MPHDEEHEHGGRNHAQLHDLLGIHAQHCGHVQAGKLSGLQKEKTSMTMRQLLTETESLIIMGLDSKEREHRIMLVIQRTKQTTNLSEMEITHTIRNQIQVHYLRAHNLIKSK